MAHFHYATETTCQFSWYQLTAISLPETFFLKGINTQKNIYNVKKGKGLRKHIFISA
jgi:hypothetical protein